MPSPPHLTKMALFGRRLVTMTSDRRARMHVCVCVRACVYVYIFPSPQAIRLSHSIGQSPVQTRARFWGSIASDRAAVRLSRTQPHYLAASFMWWAHTVTRLGRTQSHGTQRNKDSAQITNTQCSTVAGCESSLHKLSARQRRRRVREPARSARTR